MISRETMELVNRLTMEGRDGSVSKATLLKRKRDYLRTVFRIDSGRINDRRPPIERSVRKTMQTFWPFDQTYKFDLKCYLRKRM